MLINSISERKHHSLAAAVCAITAVLPFHTTASDLQLLYTAGTPTSNQNVDVNTTTLELMYAPRIKDRFGFDIGGGVGRLLTEAEDANMLMADAGLKIRILQNFHARLGGGARYLEEHRFSAEQGRTKDYGGSMLWAYSTSLEWSSPKSAFAFGYKYEHMSNAGRYEHNPGLDTHNLTLSWYF